MCTGTETPQASKYMDMPEQQGEAALLWPFLLQGEAGEVSLLLTKVSHLYASEMSK